MSRYIKNISDVYSLQASDIILLDTSYTNVDLVVISKKTDWIAYGNTNNNFGTQTVVGYRELNNFLDDVSANGGYINRFSNTSWYIEVTKGTYANLSAAQTALAGTKIIYQLATPIITEILPNTVKSSPNGSVQYLNIRGEVGYYGTNIAVTNSALPIKSLSSVKKISIADGSETNIDLTTCTIASGGLTFTSTALTNGDLVDWNYEFDSAQSTTPLIEYEYNNNTFIQEPWTTPTFENSWVSYSTARAVKYRKTSIGEVKLKGLAKSGTIGQTIFTLPTGYRPIQDMMFPIPSNGVFGILYVYTTGQVICTVGNNTYVSLDSISFFTD